MDIKNILNNTKIFLFQRLSELIGILFIIFSILLFLSLVTYSPDDPNFIFSENIEIKNKLGIYGSYVSDFFFSVYWTYIIYYTYLYNHDWSEHIFK